MGTFSCGDDYDIGWGASARQADKRIKELEARNRHLEEQLRGLSRDRPEPATPDLIAAREAVAEIWRESGDTSLSIEDLLEGKCDKSFDIKIALKAVRRGREMAGSLSNAGAIPTQTDRELMGTMAVGVTGIAPPIPCADVAGGGWTEWSGGENPASGYAVDVRFRGGGGMSWAAAGELMWRHSDNQRSRLADIVAYRISQ